MLKIDQPNAIIQPSDIEALQVLATQADQVAADNRFTIYRSTKSEETTRRQLADLNLFAQFIHQQAPITLTGQNFLDNPAAWSAVSGGLVESYKYWMINQGYNIRSINVRLSTIRTYARLAFQAGYLDDLKHLSIQAVKGFSQKEAGRIDEKREKARVGAKKIEATPIKRISATALKHIWIAKRPQKPSHLRDRLLMCLLLDHGLRVGEVAIMQTWNINPEDNEMRFYRPKTRDWSIHKLTEDTADIIHRYLDDQNITDTINDESPLLKASNKSGQLLEGGMSTRAINQRVRIIGQALEIQTLSPHDCRHAWATEAAKHSSLDALMQAGGWSSPAMPLRYIEGRQIANEGIIITY